MVEIEKLIKDNNLWLREIEKWFYFKNNINKTRFFIAKQKLSNKFIKYIFYILISPKFT